MKTISSIIPTLFRLFVITNFKLKQVNSEAALYTKSKFYNELKRDSLQLTTFRDSVNETISSNSNSSNSTKSLLELDEELALCGPTKIDIREITVKEIQKYFKNGKLLSVGLTICYLRRISAMNPKLKAVIEVNPDAVKIALLSDYERAMGMLRGPLHGIPILIKDNIATADKMQTTAGSLALVDLKPKRDARVVKKLRVGGAVILGKTNLSEFAFFRGTNIPDGWSSRGGQTVCPYLSSVDPNGSSSGSAVAVAANLAPLALGTETDGSIISPSSRQALVGLKTTHGLVSNSGVIPLSFSQDVVGPMTRTVEDAATLLHVISDEGHKLGKCGLNLKRCLNQNNFRVGVVREPFWNISSPIMRSQLSQLEAVLKAFNDTGSASIVDPVKSQNGSFEKVSSDSEFVVLLHEFKHGLNEYLNKMVVKEAILNKNISSLSDIIRFNQEHPSPEGYNQEILIAADKTDGITNTTYKTVLDQNRNASKEFLDYLFDTYELDALVGPNEEDPNNPVIFSMAAISGYPSITVPAGYTDLGVPFGISFVGRAFSEATLLKIASLVEKSYPVRKRPMFK